MVDLNLIHMPPAFISQIPLGNAGQILLVTGISFAVITLITSTYRFHRMIQLEESDLATIENLNDFFFIQITRYLSKINRKSTAFGIVIFQFETEEAEKRPVQEVLLEQFKSRVREETDKLCLFREDCIGLIIDADESDLPAVTDRLKTKAARVLDTVPEIVLLRGGAGYFPAHGITTQGIINAAVTAMEKSPFQTPPTIHTAEVEVPEEEKKETPEKIGELTREDRGSALDPLTGVLKAGVLGSYMRKYLAEMRRKKEPVTMLCVGISRIEHIEKLHGAEAVDAVIAGISRILQRLTRESDLIGRYQPHEFMVMCPCTIEQGENIAVRLRNAVRSETFQVDSKRIKTQISIGLAVCPEHGRNLPALFKASYRALEVLSEWDTASSLVYNPEKHGETQSIERPLNA